ncbi:MAG: hypothetical protein KGH59_04900 [Candidatus Micrarchaeota archaeon]|nr:hypothetical protein [Candidatus Micrarchaeota archaeon]MDE1805087.1 hypothetical protein [Candidatus Micrarchaeota archaeon]MDE1847045.1 hypothetical protein [Candidatus Micrarchaeota archaeon]
MKGLAPLTLIVAAIVFICAVGATVYYVYATNNPAPTLPNLSVSGDPSVKQLEASPIYQTLSTQTHVNSALLSATQPNAPDQYNLTYSGKISMVASIHGAPVPIGVPISITNLKYANDSKLAVSLTSIPVVGSINASIVKLGDSVYACAPQNPLSKNSTYSCFSQPPTSMNSLTLFYLVQGLNLTVNHVYPSEYAGTSCAAMNSTFVIPIGEVRPFLSQLSFLNGIVNVSAINGIDGSLQSCISSVGLPVTADMSLSLYSQSATSTLQLTLAQSAVGTAASDSSIRQLPGPVQ